MTVDVRVDPLDKIQIHDDTAQRMDETFRFAVKDGERLKSFVRALDYCLHWGKGEDGRSPTQIMVSPDFTPHSYGFAITTFRFDDEKRAIVANHPMFIMLYYRASDDRWETHS